MVIWKVISPSWSGRLLTNISFDVEKRKNCGICTQYIFFFFKERVIFISLVKMNVYTYFRERRWNSYLRIWLEIPCRRWKMAMCDKWQASGARSIQIVPQILDCHKTCLRKWNVSHTRKQRTHFIPSHFL